MPRTHAQTSAWAGSAAIAVAADGEADPGRNEQRAPRPGEAIADQRDGQPGRDGEEVDREDQLAGVPVRPAALGEGVRQPGREAVVDERRRHEERDEEPRDGRPQREARTPADRARRRASRADEPPRERARGRGREHEQRHAPRAARIGERHREQGREGRAELDGTRVDARDEQRAVGEALLHGDHHERVAEPHADPDRDRERDHAPPPRARPSARDRRRRSAPARSPPRAWRRRAPRAAPRAARTRPCRSPGSR